MDDTVCFVCFGVELDMACTYSTIEIRKTPEFRVYKKCLFHNISCAEVRGAGKCPLLKHTPTERAANAGSIKGDERGMLNEELQKFDEIPSFGEDYKSPIAAVVEKPEQPPQSQPRTVQSEVDLLKAELSDFMEKIETKKEKPPARATSSVSKRVLEEPGRGRTKKVDDE